MLSAEELLPVRKADGTTFKASPMQVMMVTNVSLEGLTPEQVAKVKNARATFAKIGTDREAFDSLLKQIADEPGLRGMADMLLALQGDEKAARLFSDLSSQGKLGLDFNAMLLSSPGWARQEKLSNHPVGQFERRARFNQRRPRALVR